MPSLAHSEKPHPNASPIVTFPMVSEENAKTNRGVVLLDAPWRWLVDNVGPEDHSEFAVTSSPVQQDPACSPWPTTELPHWHSRRLRISASVALSSGWARARTVTLVDFQSVSTLRNSNLFGENILRNVATTKFSLIPFPFAKRKT